MLSDAAVTTNDEVQISPVPHFETGSYVSQPCLKLATWTMQPKITLSVLYPSASTSQAPGFPGMLHHVQFYVVLGIEPRVS